METAMPEPKRQPLKDVMKQGREVIEDATSEEKPIKQPDPQDVLIPTSLRLPQSMITRLNRASFEQKEAKKRPQTRQDIIIEALGEWLDRYEKRKK
jgi:hypothetical protein